MPTRRVALLALLTACGGTGGDGTPTGAATGVATGTGLGTGTGSGTGTGTGGTTAPGTCPSAHLPVREVACISTTADLGVVGTGYGDNWTANLAATVVAPPPGPTNVPGAPMAPACDGTLVGAAQTLELLDENGATWVVGWEVEGPDGVDAALASLTPGQPVSLAARAWFATFSGGLGVALHDGMGPVVLIDREALDATGRGFDVAVRRDVCETHGSGSYLWDEYELTFSTPIDDLVLFTGQRGTLDHPGRTLDVAVDQAGWPQGCLDGCGYTGFAAWAANP